GPDAAAMPVQNALHCRKSDARTFEVLRSMEALKDPEKFVGIPRVKSNSIVANKHNCFVPHFFRADLDDRRGTPTGKFQSICKEVCENNFDEAGIAHHIRKRADPPFD